jgi:hypothetical protein
MVAISEEGHPEASGGTRQYYRRRIAHDFEKQCRLKQMYRTERAENPAASAAKPQP